MDMLLMEANRVGARIIRDATDDAIAHSREMGKLKREAIRIEQERIEIEEQKARNRVWRKNKDSFDEMKEDVVVKTRGKKRQRLSTLEKYARKKVNATMARYRYSVAKSVHDTPSMGNKENIELNLNFNVSRQLSVFSKNKVGVNHE